MSASDTVTTCYRHPDREAPLGCSRCENPICLDDAINAPVGFLCPDCARQPARVQRAQRSVARSQDTPATTVLLVVIGVVYVAQTVLRSAGIVSLVQEGALQGQFIAAGDWWRLLTSGFLHGGIIHVGFNAYLLYLLGQMLERGLGSARFLPLYFAGLFGGSVGALLLDHSAFTIGASGAVFGLMGAAMVGLNRRGINPWQTQIGSLVIFNLIFTFLFPNISIGGHIGGLVGGALAGLAIYNLDGANRQVGVALAWGLVALLAGVGLLVANFGPFF